MKVLKTPDAIFLVLFAVSGLFWLAVAPQNPDGAEMLTVALHGGVMHPSGTPLQAWLNLAAVRLLPTSPGWSLSLVSWLAFVAGLGFLMATLKNLGVHLLARALAFIFYAFHPILLSLALQPEKYALMNLTNAMAFWLMTLTPRPWAFGAVFGLSAAQHLSAIVLLPSILLNLWSERRHRYKGLAIFTAIGVGIILLFVLSLIWLRSEAPWVNWGQIESATDAIRHYLRKDFQFFALHTIASPLTSTTNGWLQLVHSLRSYPALLLLTPLAVLSLWRTQRSMSIQLVLFLISCSWLLLIAELPVSDPDHAAAYAERYSVIILPGLALCVGVGAQVFFMKKRWRKYLAIAGMILLSGLWTWRGLKAADTVDNNLGEIFFAQAASELEPGAMYFTTNDYEAFHGIRCATGLCFPIKDLFGFPWYTGKVAPRLEPRLNDLLKDFPRHPSNFLELVQMAIQAGFTVTLSSAALLLQSPETMKLAEQTGVLWTFSLHNRSLYTDKILKNTKRLCADLANAKHGIQQNHFGFTNDFLTAFRFAFQGAADAYTSIGRPQAASLAQRLSDALTPGHEPSEWRALCAEYINL